MQPLPKNIARLAGWGVAACAVIGLYLGASKSYGGGSDAYGGAMAGSDHVASAKAIAPPPPPVFDEAAIRRIAREEAQTLVAKAPAPVASNATRKRSAPSSTRDVTTPSDAGLVYARPPSSGDTGPSPAPSAAPTPAQVDQY